MTWLIVLLLISCYAADWTDDYYSYSVANRYSVFEAANGRKPLLIGGGGLNSSAMLGAMRMSGSATTQQTSALEAVFGSPNGSSPGSSADDQFGKSLAAGGLRSSRSGLSGAQGAGSRGTSSLTTIPE